jgi:hypothetical protein
MLFGFCVALGTWSLGYDRVFAANRFECPTREACKGCGCKGGPGFRDNKSRKCVSFRELKRKCGVPADPLRCTFENEPNAGQNYQCSMDAPNWTPVPSLN